MTNDHANQVTVSLGDRSYEIDIVSDRLAHVAQSVERWQAARFGESTGRRLAVVVTDANVRTPHAEAVLAGLRESHWNAESIVLDPGERSKRLEVIAGMYDRLVEWRADRQTVIIAVGGGVIGDAAGFLAATYVRGLPFVQVPTTLLADVDSSVGGKVGINHEQAKNLIGAFHQPLGVVIDTQALSTLPDRDYRSGLAEVIKYGVILDAAFFEYLEQHIDGLIERDPVVLRHIISRSCRLKADVVERDEYERIGLRAVLNYGHTFAHAYEALCGYGELRHGEAVAIGMIDASRLAERRGLIDPQVTERQHALLTAVGLPTELAGDRRLPADDVISRMALDKKSVAGQLRFVLPSRIGHVEIHRDIPEADVRAVLE